MHRRLVLLAGLATAFPAWCLAGPYTEAGRAVIHINVEGTLKQPAKGNIDHNDFATGFVVSPDGLIMTAGHVAPNPDLFKPGELWLRGRFPKLKERAMIAEDPPFELSVVRAARGAHDVALLKITNLRGPLPFLRLCDAYRDDEKIQVLGYPAGDKRLANTRGFIKTPASGPDPLIMQVPITRGDSGAPVLNEAGAVFAIAYGGKTANEERLPSTSLAATLPNAIADLSPEALALLGVSYHPDCSKRLQAALEPRVFENTKREVFSIRGGRQIRVNQRFEAPPGSTFETPPQFTVFSTTSHLRVDRVEPRMSADGRT